MSWVVKLVIHVVLEVVSSFGNESIELIKHNINKKLFHIWLYPGQHPLTSNGIACQPGKVVYGPHSRSFDFEAMSTLIHVYYLSPDDFVTQFVTLRTYAWISWRAAIELLWGRNLYKIHLLIDLKQSWKSWLRVFSTVLRQKALFSALGFSDIGAEMVFSLSV